jgi:S1-C subfamily serine protease
MTYDPDSFDPDNRPPVPPAETPPAPQDPWERRPVVPPPPSGVQPTPPPAENPPAPPAPGARPSSAPGLSSPPVPPAAPPADSGGYAQPPYYPPDAPLPVCDYTTDSDEPCEEPSRVKRWSGAAVVTSATIGAVIGGVLVAAALVWAFGLFPGSGQTPSTPTSSTAATPANFSITANSSNLDIAEAVAKKAVPSVVNVTIQQAVIDPFTGNKSYQDLGNGSGVIIRSNGYILTNNHVVSDADRILVSVGVTNKVAKVIGTDSTTDLAVIKIDGSGYPAIQIGSSKNLQVGQWVMAVGSPFGLEKTVTSGIVSALQRSEQAQGQSGYDLTTYTNLIQTDAAINPGNSGGALVDDQGKLVGLNSLIQSPSGGVGAAQSAGIGFAIPADFAIDIANQLIATGHATHPYMGVTSQTVDESVAAQFGLNVKSGALVRFVAPGSPAEAGGIKAGDIITKIGTTNVTAVSDVFSAIRDHKINEKVPVVVVRNGRTLTLSVTLGSDSSNAG